MRPHQPTKSIDSCAGVRTRSERFVTSGAVLPAVHVSPEKREAVVRVASSMAPGTLPLLSRIRTMTARTLRVEIEGWVDPDLPAKDADAIGRLVADKLSRQLPETGSFTWTTRAAPA